ncbi:MAG: NAD(P)-binding protein [Pseudomonadota bacterium]
MPIETDYLIIGAGVSGLAFADEMLTSSDAHITLVDKRHAPGGHWNDAYPFVRLHQPSSFYGVQSRELSDFQIDESGPNKGFMTLADGPQIVHYLHGLMRERLLASGRVRYVPLSEVTDDGAIRSLLSGERTEVDVRRKIVDASYYTNSVPQTHVRKFAVADSVDCIPPNDLPRRAVGAAHFCVLGAGKTAMDACVWLLVNGVTPDRVTWVIPRDSWLVNRASTQPGSEFFEPVFEGFVANRQAIAEADSAQDLAHRMEAANLWLRLDPEVEPAMFHAATVSETELQLLQSVGRKIRMGRVEEITAKGLRLQQGEAECPRETLYVDCTASALVRKPAIPVFAGNRITLQMLRIPLIPFSAALIAFLEAAQPDDDARKNRFTTPMQLPDTVDDFIRSTAIEYSNRLEAARDPDVRAWTNSSRLEGYARIAKQVAADNAPRQAILQRLKEATMAAASNLPRLLETLG